MKKYSLFATVAMLLTLSSCELVGDIFSAGVKVGIFIAVAVAALVIFLLVKMFSR